MSIPAMTAAGKASGGHACAAAGFTPHRPARAGAFDLAVDGKICRNKNRTSGPQKNNCQHRAIGKLQAIV